jgi:hypothetical protein
MSKFVKNFRKFEKIENSGNFSEISESDSLKNSIKRFNNSFPALIRAEIPATGAGERGLHPGALAVSQI